MTHAHQRLPTSLCTIETYPLPCLRGNAEEQLTKGQFDLVGPVVEEFVFSEQFRISDQAPALLELVRFAHEPSTDEILRTFALMGFTPPHEEDALRFGAALASQTYPVPVVFLHTDNLWRVPGSREQVCVVDLSQRRRLYSIWYRNNWGKRYIFAARKH